MKVEEIIKEEIKKILLEQMPGIPGPGNLPGSYIHKSTNPEFKKQIDWSWLGHLFNYEPAFWAYPYLMMYWKVKGVPRDMKIAAFRIKRFVPKEKGQGSQRFGSKGYLSCVMKDKPGSKINFNNCDKYTYEEALDIVKHEVAWEISNRWDPLDLIGLGEGEFRLKNFRNALKIIEDIYGKSLWEKNINKVVEGWMRIKKDGYLDHNYELEGRKINKTLTFDPWANLCNENNFSYKKVLEYIDAMARLIKYVNSTKKEKDDIKKHLNILSSILNNKKKRTRLYCIIQNSQAKNTNDIFIVIEKYIDSIANEQNM